MINQFDEEIPFPGPDPDAETDKHFVPKPKKPELGIKANWGEESLAEFEKRKENRDSITKTLIEIAEHRQKQFPPLTSIDLQTLLRAAWEFGVDAVTTNKTH